MSILPERNLQIQYISNQNFNAIYTEVKQTILKFVWNHKRPQIAKNLEKEQRWRLHAPWLQLYYKAIVIKTVWYCHKNRHVCLQNRIESPEINLHVHGQLIYNKGAKNIQWGKDSIFNKWCWKNWTATYKRIKLDHYLTTHRKMD